MKKFLALIRFVLVLLLTVMPSVAGASSDSPLRILVLGDSLAAGYGLAAEDAFPMRLEQSLRAAGRNVEVINAGVSGDTTAGGLARLDWALADQPQVVIIELGANDALRGLPPEQTRENLDAIISRLKQAGVAVLLAGMRAPRNLGSEYYNKFDNLYPELAAKHEVALYPFFLEGVATKQAYNQPDGIHPNQDGVQVIVKNILPAVERLLDRVTAAGQVSVLMRFVV
jgi:acyl-CoA thioesterase-1